MWVHCQLHLQLLHETKDDLNETWSSHLLSWSQHLSHWYQAVDANNNHTWVGITADLTCLLKNSLSDH